MTIGVDYGLSFQRRQRAHRARRRMLRSALHFWNGLRLGARRKRHGFIRRWLRWHGWA